MPEPHRFSPPGSRPTIGVLAGWQFYNIATSLSYLLPLYKGITRAARELGCNLLLGCGVGVSASLSEASRPAWPAPAPDVDFVPIGAQNTDGLIVFPPLHSPVRSAYIQGLRAAGHPVLFVGAGESGPTLAADNAGGITEAVRHLVQHSHHKIAFIAGSTDDLAGDTGERLNAYQAALQAHGLKLDPRLVIYGSHVYSGGYSAIQQMLAGGAEFSAVLTSNDEMALGAMQALREAGRRVPGEVAIIGFDNRLEGAAHNPPLSSIHIPLYNMGQLALECLFRYLQGQGELPNILRIPTRLIARESCGCGSHKISIVKSQPVAASPQPPAEPPVQWVEELAETVMSQARNLNDQECRLFCQRLLDIFPQAIAQKDSQVFLRCLEDVVQQTVAGEDDAQIWQAAITLLGKQFRAIYHWDAAATQRLDELLDQARQTVSAHMQRQHHQYVSTQSSISSCISLLTAGLLTALDEAQIYAILAEHLPVMDIHLALMALVEGDEHDPVGTTSLLDVFAPDQAPLRFRSYDFPLEHFFAQDQPFHLALVPLLDQTGQLGYMIFEAEHVERYGAIVQQLGGALNTARLYRQATEGRRLAEEANRMKSRFLSVISHELRTPLNLIIGMSEIVLRKSDEEETPLPEATHKDIERIHSYSQHLGGLIGDVLDIATSDAGQLRLNNDFIDLSQALRIVAESGRQLAADKGLTWEAVLPESGPWIWGDRTRLRQVALNLINNAVKFTERGGVSMRIEAGVETVTVLVSDTGLGIPSSEQQVIFDEFRQSEHSVALGYKGLGLGLAISKRLVEMHGGTIGVHSSGKMGTGSTFYFNLPVVQPAFGPDGIGERMPLPANHEQTVMILTNHPASSERLSAQLTQRGFHVQVTNMSAASEWQAQLLELAPDAVLMDVGLASDAGWEALKVIKSSPAAREVPVMFYTSAQANNSVLELDYLTKPVEADALTRALDQQYLLANDEKPRRTILVVDDDPNTLDMNARIVQSHSSSNHVLQAHNGRLALDILQREPVDLVLLDLQMPEMDGFGVLETMRENERTRTTPVIVVTGKVLTGQDMARLNRGVAAVLEKGLFSLDETVEHISSALEHKRRLSREAQRLVRKAMAYIHEHYTDSISRRDIAQHVSISDDHLTFCFRQELGTTPIDYLQRYRINQARRLLQDSERSISEIALDVGFSDSGYFSRVFRRNTGMSPEAFRRSGTPSQLSH